MENIDFQYYKSIEDIVNHFPSEEFCIRELENIRWAGDVISPFDQTSKIYTCKDGKYRCRNTGKYFNVRTHTIFHNTKIGLTKWFQAIWLVTNSEKLTAIELGKKIDVTPKTAWLMQRRIAKYVKSKPKMEKVQESQLAITDWLTQLK